MMFRIRGWMSASARGRVRGLGAPVLMGAAVLFASAVLLLGVNVAAMRSNLGWIEHTQRTLGAISAAEAGVVGIELTVRSYALTGDPRFLLFQRNERVKLETAMNELAGLAAADPQLAQRFGRIRQLVGGHLAVYARLTGLGPDRAREVGLAINDNTKRKVTSLARTALADLRLDEVQVLGERQAALTQQISRAFVLGVGIIVAAMVLGGLGLLVTRFGFASGH